jgi:hypothetical protein
MGCREGERVNSSELHGATRGEDGEGHDVLGEDLLLAAEPAADARREDAHLLGRQLEQPADLALHEERDLRAGAEDEAALLHPADRRVRLQVRVRDALRGPRARHDLVGLREPARHVAVLAVHLRDDVALRVGEAGDGGVLVAVQQGRAGAAGEVGVQDRG